MKKIYLIAIMAAVVFGTSGCAGMMDMDASMQKVSNGKI